MMETVCNSYKEAAIYVRSKDYACSIKSMVLVAESKPTISISKVKKVRKVRKGGR